MPLGSSLRSKRDSEMEESCSCPNIYQILNKKCLRYFYTILHCLSEPESQVCLVTEKHRYFYHMNSILCYKYALSPKPWPQVTVRETAGRVTYSRNGSFFMLLSFYLLKARQALSSYSFFLCTYASQKK